MVLSFVKNPKNAKKIAYEFMKIEGRRAMSIFFEVCGHILVPSSQKKLFGIQAWDFFIESKATLS